MARMEPMPFAKFHWNHLNHLRDYMQLAETGWHWNGDFIPVPSDIENPVSWRGWCVQELAEDTTEGVSDKLRMRLLWDLRSTLPACAVHSCRDTCRNRSLISKKGFCRLGFWHWHKHVVDCDFPTWSRLHGHALVMQATIQESLPGFGTVSTHLSHPY